MQAELYSLSAAEPLQHIGKVPVLIRIPHHIRDQHGRVFIQGCARRVFQIHIYDKNPLFQGEILSHRIKDPHLIPGAVVQLDRCAGIDRFVVPDVHKIGDAVRIQIIQPVKGTVCRLIGHIAHGNGLGIQPDAFNFALSVERIGHGNVEVPAVGVRDHSQGIPRGCLFPVDQYAVRQLENPLFPGAVLQIGQQFKLDLGREHALTAGRQQITADQIPVDGLHLCAIAAARGADIFGGDPSHHIRPEFSLVAGPQLQQGVALAVFCQFIGLPVNDRLIFRGMNRVHGALKGRAA